MTPERAPVLEIVLAAWAVLSGAAIGSFLNVVVARLPAGESIVHPRSRCPSCLAPIAWYDNLPVLSWLLLRARCRACRAPISVRYPLVELAGGGAAWMAFARRGLTPAALAEFAFVAALLVIALIDLDTWSVYRIVSFPLIGLGLLANASGAGAAGSLGSAVTGAAVAFGALGLFAWGATVVFRRLGRIEPWEEAMGFGDVHILTAAGAFLGVGALLPVLLLASIQGSLVGGLLVLVGRSTRGVRQGGEVHADGFAPPRHAIPFGPFLALAAVEWLYVAAPLVSAVPALSPFL
ncbi:MAG TPA: prepilin peptidase [Anaeromyxobacteraceae bacterium]|nr:prepilin peptidase [Anaeromyxobacteraceae bacterium]